MYGRWNHAAQMEGGVDLTSPGGTPIYALATGPLIGAGNFWHSSDLYTPGSGNPGYGVVTQRVNVPGYGPQDLYYQHIQIAPGISTCYANACNNQIVQKGQLIGWTTPGVNEVEMGFNANWGGVWGINHPGPWATDPRPMLATLAQGAGNYQGPVGTDGTTSSGGAAQPCGPLDITCMLSGLWASLQGPLVSWGEHVAIFVLAAVLIVLGFFLLAEKQAMGAVKAVA